MKQIFATLFFATTALCSNAQTKDSAQIVEASCGQCNFGLKEPKGCDLAVRINGTAYFVDGANINKFGDSHAKDGFCNAIRKAKVTGKVEEGRFVASSFVLLPAAKKQ